MNLLALTGPAGLVVDAVVKGTLFLLFLFLATPLLHRLSAGARHVVWGAGIVLLVGLPLLSHIVPWRIGVIPVVATADAPSPRHAPRIEAPSAPGVPGQGPTAERAGVPAPARVAGAGPAPTTFRLPPVSGWLVALGIWLAGVVIALVRLGLAQRSATALVASARPVTGDDWDEPKELAAARLGLERTPDVMITDRLPLPVTTGLRHPVILLPAEAAEWPALRRESVLLHEMAHVARWDLATHLAARLVCAAWWFHPLAWRALGRFRAESERAADDLVLAAGRRASEYAQDLLAVVQSAGRSRAPVHALAMAQRSDFEGRLLAILEPGASRRGVTPMTAVPLVLAVSIAALPLAALGPARAAALPSPTASEVQEPIVVPTPTPTPTPVPTPVVPMALGGGRGFGVSVRPKIGPIHVNVRGAGRGVGVGYGVSAPALAGMSHRTTEQDRQAAAGLVAALADNDASVRESAARGLGNLGVSDTAVVTALSRALANDSDDGVRRAAAWALGQLEDAAAVSALTTALKRDRDLEVRRTCAWALGQLEDHSAVDALTGALNDPDTELRNKAVWALGQIEDARAVTALVGVLRDPDVDTRAQAVWALGQIGSKDATEGLGRAASDSSPRVRSQVAWALGQIEDARSVPALGRLLHDPVADVRKQAAWALGQIESKESVGDLSAALHDSDGEVRRQAAWALGQIQDQGSAAALAGALKDSDAEVRKNAAWALGQLDLHQAPQGLLDAFNDANAEVRKNAAWAAGQISDAAAIPGLNKLLVDGDREVQRTAVWALGQMDDPHALDGLTRLLQSSDPELRRMAVQALGRGH